MAFLYENKPLKIFFDTWLEWIVILFNKKYKLNLQKFNLFKWQIEKNIYKKLLQFFSVEELKNIDKENYSKYINKILNEKIVIGDIWNFIEEKLVEFIKKLLMKKSKHLSNKEIEYIYWLVKWEEIKKFVVVKIETIIKKLYSLWYPKQIIINYDKILKKFKNKFKDINLESLENNIYSHYNRYTNNKLLDKKKVISLFLKWKLNKDDKYLKILYYIFLKYIKMMKNWVIDYIILD